MEFSLYMTKNKSRPDTGAARDVTPIVLNTKVDTQSDKLTTVVGRTMIKTPATVDQFSTSRVWDKVPEGSILISGNIQISYTNALQGNPTVASVPKKHHDLYSHFDTLLT